jgi:hypothetical protein
MSILIDILIKNHKFDHIAEFYADKDRKVFAVKPLCDQSPYYTFRQRVKDAWRIMRCRGIAVHYKEDE